MSLLLTSDEITKRTLDILKEKLVLPKVERGNPSASTGKCMSCGSHEYIRASGSIICSYCRVPKNGFTVLKESSGSLASEMGMTKFDCIWGAGLIRPNVAVRISGDSEK